jgi:hypothetical protein
MATQNFAKSGKKIGHNTGFCLDLGGAGWFNASNGQGKPAILWTCSGDRNQQWYVGVALSGSTINSRALQAGDVLAVAGKAGTFVWNGSALISQDGGGLVASGGGNIVASGAGNLVASGGGNIVTAKSN